MSLLNKTLPTLLALGLLIFSPANAGKPDLGTLKGGVYKNNYFRMTLSIPRDWNPQDDETRMRIMATGSRVLAGDNQALRAKLENSRLRTINLFAIFRHPLGSAVRFNHNIAAVAENLGGAPHNLTGGDYLKQTKRLLLKGRLNYSFPDNQVRTINIGGRTFYTMHSKLRIRDLVVYQDYYATIMKGYAIGIVISYIDNQQKQAVLDIVSRIRFNRR